MEQATYETIPRGAHAFRWTGDASDLEKAFGWLGGTGQVLGAEVIASGGDTGRVRLKVGTAAAAPGQWVLLSGGIWTVMDDDRFTAAYRKAG